MIRGEGEKGNVLSGSLKGVSRKRPSLDFREGTLHFLNTYRVLSPRLSTLQELSP